MKILEVNKINLNEEETERLTIRDNIVDVKAHIGEDLFINIKIDTEEELVATYDDDAMYSFYYELNNKLIAERDDLNLTEEEFELMAYDIDNQMHSYSEDIAKYDSYDGEENEEPEDESIFRILTSMGDVYTTSYDSINWDHNADNIEVIEQSLNSMHTIVARMMAGQATVEEVDETATEALSGMNIKTDYAFPVENVSPREIAILKMFDAYSAYASIFAYAAAFKAYRDSNKRFEEFQEGINGLIQSMSEGISGVDIDDISDVDEAVENINTEGD